MLNISDFSLFLCKNCTTTPEKSHPHLFQQFPFKTCDHDKPSPLFWKFGKRFNSPVEIERLTLCFLDIQDLFGTPINYWFLGFNCVLLIIKTAGLKTSRPTFLGKMFGSISWNRLIIFNGDMKCALLISFPVQNLITSDNQISRWLWWIWN